MRTVVAGGSVFDGTGAPAARADVAIEDGRIVDVGSGLDGDARVDVGGGTILPGLFDCHTHVTVSSVDLWQVAQRPFSYQFYEAARNLEATIRIGITTVRDAGGADLGIKEAVEDGLTLGPRLQISIIMLSQTGGHGDDWYPSGAHIPFMTEHPGRPSGVVDGPDEVRLKVRELVRAGADVIKVATSGGVLSPRDDPRHAHLGRSSSKRSSRKRPRPGSSSWPTPRERTGSRTRSERGSVRSTTASTWTTRQSS
jgi:imidazolonepropionase-like amidohydrolase